MVSIKSVRKYIKNLVIVILFAIAQTISAVGPFITPAKVSAAPVPTNQTSFASFPFNLSGAYTEPGGQPTATGSFTNGNVGPYVEGACIPSLIEVTNNSDTVGDIPVSPIYDYLNDNTAINNLELLGDSPTSGNALNDPRNVANNLNDYTYPGTSLDAATSFYSSGGTVNVTSDGPYAGNNAGTTPTTSGDTFRHYNLVLQDVNPDETVYVLFCARLGVNASEYNGSSLSIRTAQGGQENIPIPVNALLRRPSLTITKVVVGGTAQPSDFTFNVSPSVSGQTLISIPSGQSSVTIDNIFPDGTFTITENSVSGYSFTSGTGTNCTFSGSTATATLTAAKTPTNASCTFTNTLQPGKIIVEKQTLPDGDPQSFAFTSNYDNDGFSLSDGQQNDSGNLDPGTYSVAETVPTGWDLTSATCSDGSPVNSIALGAGETVTCTFTNTKRGHLIVQKTTIPAADQTIFDITASSSTGGTITGGGAGTITDANDKNYEVTPGTYSVAETVPSGWSKTGDTCQNVVVAPGATVYCTITNTKLATIVIVKDALPNALQDFSFLTATLPGGNFLLDDDSGVVGADGTLSHQATFANLTPNVAYSVTEASTAGWQLTGLNCDTGNFTANLEGAQVTATPAPGQTITCTFANTKLRSISGLKYTANVGSLGPVLSGWTIQLYLDGNLVGSTITGVDGSYSFDDLLPGNYTLQEVLKTGWTQMFGPSPVSLTYDANSTGNDFGNFQNGSVSGYKWNDMDGDGDKDANEPKLSDWTIRLLRSNDNTDGNYVEVDTTVTDANGNYSFTNLSPLPSRFYAVCEVQQTGWVQTAPQNTNCRYFEINLSGESNTNRNFGNQGRGTITVNKNVDTDGDGDVDITGATDWAWDIAGGAQNTTTGSSQNVSAGGYTVNEDQKTDYHFTSVVCTRNGQTFSVTQAETINLTVNPGDTIVCTYKNTRDTGTITVKKVLNPSSDPGRFNLQINRSTAGTGANVGDGGTTGAVQIVTGSYNIGETETAGTSTNLSDYTSSYSCVDQNQGVVASGTGTLSTDFDVDYQDSVVCTITNTRFGQIIVQKQTNPADSTETFEFDTSYDLLNFNLSDGQTNNSGNLYPGNYSVAEVPETGWDLTSVTCDDQSDPSSIDLSAGEVVTCTFVNRQRATVVVTKYNDYNRDGDRDENEPVVPDWQVVFDEVTQTTLQNGTTTFSNVEPEGSHQLSEVIPPGSSWHLSGIDCGDRNGSLDGGTFYFGEESIAAGETVYCEIGNYRDVNLNIEKTNNRPEPTVVGDVVTYTIKVTVAEDSGVIFDAVVRDLLPAGFTYVSGSWTGTATEPEIGPLMVWHLGDLYPGDEVTLTYKAVIDESVSPGTYTNVAFLEGCEVKVREQECEEPYTSEFVESDVTVKAPKVLGASTTKLVETGTAQMWQNVLFSSTLLAAAVLSLLYRQKKGTN